VLEDLSRRSWCCGHLGEGWAEETLSLRIQIPESLAEECEAVGEARPPRRVAKISGFSFVPRWSVLFLFPWIRGIDDRV
jgi:hypothetical protein